MGSDRATPEEVSKRRRTRMPANAVGVLSLPHIQDGQQYGRLSPEAGRVAMVALLVAAVAAIAGVTPASMVSDWISPAHREAAIVQQFAQTRPPAEPNVNPQPTFTEAPTPCPTEQYDCQCKDRCRTDSATGRTVCTRVCNRCTRTRCN